MTAQAAPGTGKYLDIDGALAVIHSMGFTKVTRRQVVRWASERSLPFFKHGKSLYIEEHELRMWYKRRQIAAVNEALKH